MVWSSWRPRDIWSRTWLSARRCWAGESVYLYISGPSMELSIHDGEPIREDLGKLTLRCPSFNIFNMLRSWKSCYIVGIKLLLRVRNSMLSISTYCQRLPLHFYCIAQRKFQSKITFKFSLWVFLSTRYLWFEIETLWEPAWVLSVTLPQSFSNFW